MIPNEHRRSRLRAPRVRFAEATDGSGDETDKLVLVVGPNGHENAAYRPPVVETAATFTRRCPVQAVVGRSLGVQAAARLEVVRPVIRVLAALLVVITGRDKPLEPPRAAAYPR